MRIEQSRWTASDGWWTPSPRVLGDAAQLVLLFSAGALLKQRTRYEEVAAAYPKAKIFGCSTAGEIQGAEVFDDTLAVTAVEFESSQVRLASVEIEAMDRSFAAGAELARKLDPCGLVHAFVLTDGLMVNGSEVVRGLTQGLPETVAITGGLSGDGSRFEETFVIAGEPARRNTIAIIGFYGRQLRVAYGCGGGWDSFGPERRITRAEGSVLYELDGKSALVLYKRYLGGLANDLPSSALQFPLSIRFEERDRALVRTVLAVDEQAQSMTFAGDLPVGSTARFMMANIDRLIDGAAGAASTALSSSRGTASELAILVSCVGRRLVLKQRIEEELEGARDILGDQAILTGFYSYGEISPFSPGSTCCLHNQTMAVTTISERSSGG